MTTVLIWIFWVSLALGVYVYFGYPIVLALLSKIRPVRLESAGYPDSDWPDVALLIACFNEEKDIEDKLRNTLELEYLKDRLLIIVLNDGSSDSTAKTAADFAKNRPDAKIEVLDFPENRGKCPTLLRGVQWLRENHPEVRLLAFSDANAKWEPDALKLLIRPFSDPKVGSVSGLLGYLNPADNAAGEMEGVYWKYEALLKRLSSRLGALPGANGSIFALRLDAYQPLSENRGDDFELAVQAVIGGYRSILIEEAKSWEPPSPDFRTEYRRKLRITGQMIPSAWMLFWRASLKGKGLLAFELLSHKLLRYFMPLYMVLLLVSSGLLWNESTAYRIVFSLQVLFYLLAGLGLCFELSAKRPPKLARIPFYFTMVNLASLVSMIRLATGQSVRWERNR
jgi:cellulose synthase/poly-beta-1,6-N-acetylglucosamine synthase-like glycosyltransferase